MDPSQLNSYGVLGLVIGALLFIWMVLIFFVPFMIYGIYTSAKKADTNLAAINQRLKKWDPPKTPGNQEDDVY